MRLEIFRAWFWNQFYQLKWSF